LDFDRKDKDEPEKIAHRREAVSGETVLEFVVGELPMVDDDGGVADGVK
jgi:hypothetical protein